MSAATLAALKVYAAAMEGKVNALLCGGDGFEQRCRAAGVHPTRRQARKFLRGEGLSRTARKWREQWLSERAYSHACEAERLGESAASWWGTERAARVAQDAAHEARQAFPEVRG